MTLAEQPSQLTCAECGATLLIPRAPSSEHCPFCGSPHVALGPRGAAAPPLSVLLPFELPRERVIAIYRQWLGTRLFRPHGVNHEAIGQLRSIYIPAWLCQATATCVWTNPDDLETGPPASGRHVSSYPHILISASRGLPADWLIDLGGFALGQVRPVHQAALRDRIVEIAAVDRDTALAAARRQIETTERATCAASTPDLPATSLQVQTTLANPTADVVGLPLWVASFTYHGAHYRCLINGQTGTVYGEAPVSGTKIAILFGIVILAIVAVLIVTQLYGS